MYLMQEMIFEKREMVWKSGNGFGKAWTDFGKA